MVTSSGHELSGLLVIAQRDVIKLLRDRPRLAVSLAFPVLLIGGLGAILQPTVGKVTGMNAVTLAFTGVLAASLFQSAAAGMISIVEDRENDFSRELFVTPVASCSTCQAMIDSRSRYRSTCRCVPGSPPGHALRSAPPTRSWRYRS
jgi:hypothetical protein